MYMKKESGKQNGLKIVFSLISLFLMIPPLINGEASYYRTLFIFLINSVIDMFFKEKTNDASFFVVWSLLNQWIGVVACAIAFCSIAPDFAKVCESYANQIKTGMFVSAISCVLKELVVLIVMSIKESSIKEKIKSEVEKMEGESL